MKEIVYEHSHPVWFCGRQFRVQVSGEQRADKTWAGYVEFTDIKSNFRFRTEQETSQPNRDALEYWATGLEHVYMEGALTRAICAALFDDPSRIAKPPQTVRREEKRNRPSKSR
jgi:hypothetical protein